MGSKIDRIRPPPFIRLLNSTLRYQDYHLSYSFISVQDKKNVYLKSWTCLLKVIIFFCGYGFILEKSVLLTFLVPTPSPMAASSLGSRARSKLTSIGRRTASLVINFFTCRDKKSLQAGLGERGEKQTLKGNKKFKWNLHNLYFV